MRVLLCPVLAAALAAAQSQPGARPSPAGQPGQPTAVQAPPGGISGMVVRGDTGELVKRAVVTLRAVEPGRRGGSGQTAVSGSDGRFEITGIPPGQYRIRVNRNGFLTGEYGQRGFDKPGAPVTVSSGRTASNLVVKLMPAGVISGTVVNEDGERVSYVSVGVLKASYSQGRMQWMPAGSASTNDLGEYRIFDLNPGRYFLSARYSASYGLGFRPDPNSPANSPQGEEGYATQYYPGTFDPALARAIELGPGSDVRGVDIRLAPTRMLRVSGLVRFEGAVPPPVVAQSGRGGPPGGRGFGARPMVSLTPQRSIVIGGYQGRRAIAVGADGSFEIRGVTPGAYTLRADLFDRNQRQSAHLPLVVGNTNVDGVNLTLAPVPVLQGQVRIDTKDSLTLNSLRVRLQGLEDSSDPGVMIPRSGPGGAQSPGVVSAEGKFTLENLSPQVYSLILTGLPDTHYLAGVRLSDVDITNSPVNLSVGVFGLLTITVASGAGTLQGTVTQDKQPAEGATVVLVPDVSRREVGYYYKTATSDQNGQFAMKGIAPGEYKVFAWDEVESGAWRDPAYIKKFESRGTAVSVKANGQETVQLVLLTPAQGEP